MEDKLMVLFVQMAYVVANMDGVAPGPMQLILLLEAPK